MTEKPSINYLKLLEQLFAKSTSVSNQLASKRQKLSKKLYVGKNDSERIWQQIDTVQRDNLSIFDGFDSRLNDYCRNLQAAAANLEEEDEEDNNDDEDVNDADDDADEEDNTDISEPNEAVSETESAIEELKNIKKKLKTQNKTAKPTNKGPIKDLDMNAMHSFLDEMDEMDNNNDNQNSDDQDSEEDDFDEMNIYADPGLAENEDEDEDEDGDDSGSESGEDLNQIFGGKIDPKIQSSREKRKNKMDKKVEQMEEENLKTGAWQLSGEVSKSSRPENSLLTQHFDFDSLAKAVPKITNDFTEELEAIFGGFG